MYYFCYMVTITDLGEVYSVKVKGIIRAIIIFIFLPNRGIYKEKNNYYIYVKKWKTKI